MGRLSVKVVRRALSVGLIGVLAGCGGDEPKVAGVQFTRTTTTVVVTSTSTVDESAAVTAPSGDKATSTPVAPPPPPPAPTALVQPASSPPPSAVPSPAPRRATEAADNGGYFVHPDDQGGAGSATRIEPGAPDPFRFYAYAASKGSVVSFYVTIDNQSGQAVSFGDAGLVVLYRLQREGEPEPRVFELRKPELRQLMPGESLSASVEVPYDEGRYQYGASTDVEYRG